jgi:2-polyprenyl-6-hydroxyphenyl methylase/3-demethylubiquinone-9 3-methyltransferase
LVGPEGLFGNAAQAEPGPAGLHPCPDRPHWGADECDRRPLSGKRAADVGCGAGLLAEPLARLGAEVTGVDAAAENIAAAQLHAEGQGLAIDYRTGGVELLEGPFDLVTSLEVIEHVTDARGFIGGLADALARDGLLILSTPNRTATSRLLMIMLAEGLVGSPRVLTTGRSS